jgi:hypothetical protein
LGPERNGEKSKAIEQFERFVDLWKDADPVLMGKVDDARGRLTKLRG